MFLCKMSSFKGVYVLCYVDYFLFITTVEQKRLLVAGTDQSDHAIRMTPNSPHY